MKKKVTPLDFIVVFLVIVITLVILLPLLNMLAVSFSKTGYIIQNKVSFFPKGFNLDAYEMVLKQGRILRSYLNSIQYAVIGTFINLLMTAVAAYPLSRKRLAGRSVVMKLIVFTMFFSGGLIPTYMLIQNLGLIDKMWALVLPNAIWTFELLILKSFYESLGHEVFESATIDGASEYRILFQIVIPLSKAALSSIGLFYFMGHWNSFFIPMIYLNTASKYPLQLVLREMLIDATVQNPGIVNQQMNSLTPEAMKNATILLTMLPVLFVYPYAQRYFVKGVMLGSVKG